LKSRLKSIATAFGGILLAHPPRAGSLIITVFGDSISQHGNSVWLGSLIEALAPFGLNPRQIRTAVFRLVKDNWLSCVKIGRRSYYSFTEFGQRQYEKTARRIYASRPIVWDGLWTLVVPAFADLQQRDRLKRELSWLGFGSIANGILAHPCANQESLAETLQELDLGDLVVTLRAGTEQGAAREVLKRLTRQSWRLDELETRYADFVVRFRPVLNGLNKARRTEPAQMFELQTILIHEYRRILLKTTDLPDELLPAHWSGRAAMDLTARLYHLLREQSAAYLETNLEGPQGSLARADHAYFQRFA
jgi:phenylacetic acid degradation operon negative regulatory protein